MLLLPSIVNFALRVFNTSNQKKCNAQKLSIFLRTQSSVESPHNTLWSSMTSENNHCFVLFHFLITIFSFQHVLSGLYFYLCVSIGFLVVGFGRSDIRILRNVVDGQIFIEKKSTSKPPVVLALNFPLKVFLF